MAGLFSADAWEKVWTFRGTFFLGVEHTLMTAVFALFISLLLGIAFGLMSTGRNRALRAVARVYVEFIQNTPLLLQVCFLYYALAFSGNSIGIIAVSYTHLDTMIYEEKTIETIPVGPLGLIPLKSCSELGAKVNDWLVEWRKERESEHKSTIAFAGYQRDSYIIEAGKMCIRDSS